MKPKRIQTRRLTVVATPPSPPPPLQVLQLADDLAVERRNHEAARRSLEQRTQEAEDARRGLEEESGRLHAKTQEAEQRSHELAQLERRSEAIHRENLELSERIAEMNRLAEEQQRSGAAAAAAAAATGEGEGEGGSVKPPAGEGGGEEQQKELEKLRQVVEMKTCQLEAVKERVSARRRRKGGIGEFAFMLVYCRCRRAVDGTRRVRPSQHVCSSTGFMMYVRTCHRVRLHTSLWSA